MSAHQSPPKRPRLSLQIKAISSGPNLRASRTIAAVVNPSSPTSFNTLSNVYNTAVDRVSTPVDPPTAINTSARDQPLKLETQNVDQRAAHTPYVASYPETPLTAQPLSPAVAMEIKFPSTMTATPPLSAGAVDSTDVKPFSFSAQDTLAFASGTTPAVPSEPRMKNYARRAATLPADGSRGMPPYVRSRGLHSILRNSPLPPSAKTPISPRRQSLRLQEKAARRVGYESPIESVITTNQYIKSHIDLLVEDASPNSPPAPEDVLDLAMAYSGDEARDGGQTPGPFEEMRRRMAGLATRSPLSPSGGIRKRKLKEKRERNRRWVWTIGQEDDPDEEVGGAMAALRAASGSRGGPSPKAEKTAAVSASPSTTAAETEGSVMLASPMDVEVLTPSIEASFDSQLEYAGSASVVSEPVSDRRAYSLTPGDLDVDMLTPTVSRKDTPSGLTVEGLSSLRSVRQDSEGLFNPETGSRRDTPIPADMLVS